jgi:bifunctional non-homologous end joining protein LigD
VIARDVLGETPGGSDEARRKRLTSMAKHRMARHQRTVDNAQIRRLMAQLDRLEAKPTAGMLAIDAQHRLPVKHSMRLLWPKLNVTTVDLMRYYLRLAPVLFSHTNGRPLSFRRFTEGIHGPSQFHQRIKWPTPAGVRVASFPAKEKRFEARLIGGDLSTLLYCVTLGIISQDVWLSQVNRPDSPDYAVFDLDPHPSLPFERVINVAWRLHDLLDEHGVPHGVKTSGVSGLHVYVPVVNTDYRTTRMFVRQFASKIALQCPDLATVTRTIQERGKRVYLDADQNMRAKTMASPYSARHSDFAGVSAPLTWQELKEGANPKDFTIFSMPDRMRAIGDLWKGLSQGPLDLGHLAREAA